MHGFISRGKQKSDWRKYLYLLPRILFFSFLKLLPSVRSNEPSPIKWHQICPFSNGWRLLFHRENEKNDSGLRISWYVLSFPPPCLHDCGSFPLSLTLPFLMGLRKVVNFLDCLLLLKGGHCSLQIYTIQAQAETWGQFLYTNKKFLEVTRVLWMYHQFSQDICLKSMSFISLLSSVSKYYFSIYKSSKYLRLLLGVFALVFNLFIELVYTVNYFKCTESCYR